MQQLLTKQEEFSAEKGIKRSLFVKTVPLLLLGVLLVTAFASIFVFADQYGITIDEPNEDAYGQLVLNWYTSLGKDTSFMAYHPSQVYKSMGPYLTLSLLRRSAYLDNRGIRERLLTAWQPSLESWLSPFVDLSWEAGGQLCWLR